ncbi:MAG: phenylalanine--tRNA ligase beta subunit-related protein, partial [Bacilli bacterium]|nr:phenylalanine--tRNA ligase beta subunit-related protein [Bacilli bacterium]
MKIIIDSSISRVLPEFSVIAMAMDVEVEDSSKIKDLILQYEKQIPEEYSLSDVLNIPLIKEARDGYKRLGKDPSRYRLACESLLRRLVKKRGLYLINNIVDAGNILSIETKRSVAVLDYSKIEGDVVIRLG